MKLYKATTSFAGKVCMAVNEERRLADKDAVSLLKAGYIKPVKEEQLEEQQSGNDDAESVGETAENVTETAETVAETAESVAETAESVTETAKQSKSKKK